MRVGPARDISCCKHTRSAGFEVLVDHNTPIDRETRLFGQGQGGAHSNTQNHKVRFQRGSARQQQFRSVKFLNRFPQVEDNPVAFMKPTNQEAHFRSHHRFQGLLIGRYHINRNAKRPQ